MGSNREISNPMVIFMGNVWHSWDILKSFARIWMKNWLTRNDFNW